MVVQIWLRVVFAQNDAYEGSYIVDGSSSIFVDVSIDIDVLNDLFKFLPEFGFLVSCFAALRHIERCIFAIEECGLSNCQRGLNINFHSSQVSAATAECCIADRCNRAGNRDFCQTTTIPEFAYRFISTIYILNGRKVIT